MDTFQRLANASPVTAHALNAADSIRFMTEYIERSRRVAKKSANRAKALKALNQRVCINHHEARSHKARIEQLLREHS